MADEVMSGHVTAAQLKTVAEGQKAYVDAKVKTVDDAVKDIVIPAEATAEEIAEITGLFTIEGE